MNTATPRGAIVFDLDGTLVDTSLDIVGAVNAVRDRLGLGALDPRAVLDEVGHGAAHLIARVTGLPPGGAEHGGALASFRSHYRAHQGEGSRLYPGIRPMLESLASEFDLYVLSNKPVEAVRREAAIQGIDGAFRALWGGGSHPALKPDPAGIRAALEASGVDPSRGAMVGDLPVDIEAGAAAQVAAFLVTWGFGAGRAVTVPHVTVEDSTGLAAAIRAAIPPRT